MRPSDIIQSNGYFGRIVNITKSKNAINSNRTGVIVNETKNMIFLINQQNKDIIRIPKNEISEYEIYLDGQICTLDGKRLLGRPEELGNIIK